MTAPWNVARALLLVSWVLLLVAGRRLRGWCAAPARGDLDPAAAEQIDAEYRRTRARLAAQPTAEQRQLARAARGAHWEPVCDDHGWTRPPELPITYVERFG